MGNTLSIGVLSGVSSGSNVKCSSIQPVNSKRVLTTINKLVEKSFFIICSYFDLLPTNILYFENGRKNNFFNKNKQSFFPDFITFLKFSHEPAL